MKKVGVWPAKAMPPHRGHLSVILTAATIVEKLYVVVSEHEITNSKLCEDAGIPYIPGELRVEWLKKELDKMPHIEVKLLNETNLPAYPNGWEPWTKELQNVVGEHIDYFFCGDKDYNTYAPEYKKYFPDAETIPYDESNIYFNISATEIRNNPLKHWDYILGAVRPFFAKKIMITGPDKCGKSILTKSLAKMYHTSYSNCRLCDEDALNTSNRVCFFERSNLGYTNYDCDAIFIINDKSVEFGEIMKEHYNNNVSKIYVVEGTYSERLQYVLKTLQEII